MGRVVLLHSAIGDSRLWVAQVEALAADFEVLAPDLPGWGTEPMPEGGFSFLDTVSQRLPAMLVGNSFGAFIALQSALAYGAEVEKLVLIAPTLPDWPFGEDMRSYWAEEDALLDDGDLAGATELNLRFWLASDYHEAVRPQQRRAFELQAGYKGLGPRWPDAKPLSSLRMPTLIVIGDRDQDDFHAIAHHLAREIPHARLVEVKNAGHIVGVEQAQRLNEILLDFLSATDDRGDVGRPR
jgi:pimeloyl-ACP methyl ester carboxylesterase